MESFIEELVLKGKVITASWLYIPLNKKVVENHFNNEMNVDIEMFTDNASVEVVAGYVNFESV